MYKEIIDWIDIVLVPAYFIVFMLILLYIKKRNPDNLLIQHYLIKGFVFKAVCAIFYALFIHYYYGFGDSLSYFKDAIYVKYQLDHGTGSARVFLEDVHYVIENFGATGGGNESGWEIEKLALILSYISFSRYLVVTLFFAMIAYSGVFKMLQTFYDIMPEWHKRLAWIILFFPSLSIFGSGVLKDTICMAALGWLFYCGHQLFVKRHYKIKYIIVLILSAIAIGVVKIYILAAFVVPYILYLIALLVRKIPSNFVRRIALPFLLLFITMIYIFNAKRIDNTLGYFAVDKLFKNMKELQNSYLTDEGAEGGATFDLGAFEPTFSGFVKKMPAGIVASVYRPFLWESKKPIILFSALESLFLLWLTLYVMFKTGLRRFFSTIASNPFIFLCLSYALIFGALIGLSTFNFGTLARYRIPLIPFYAVGLLNILYLYQKTNPQKPLQNPA